MKDNIITQKLYKDKITILFNAGNEEKEKHLYHLLQEDGKKKRLTGVTTFLGKINKPALIPWAVKVTLEYVREHIDELQDEPKHLLALAKEESNRQKQEAANIGKAVHKWIEEYIKHKIGEGDMPEMPEQEQVLNGVNSFIDWVNGKKPKFIATEKIIYSKMYGYVGQADVIAEIDGIKYLIDLKTTNGIWPEMLAQTSAYIKAFNEESSDYKLDQRIILKIDKDADIPVEPIYLDKEENTIERDFNCFLSTMTIYEWEKEANKHLKKLRD